MQGLLGSTGHLIFQQGLPLRHGITVEKKKLTRGWKVACWVQFSIKYMLKCCLPSWCIPRRSEYEDTFIINMKLIILTCAIRLSLLSLKKISPLGIGGCACLQPQVEDLPWWSKRYSFHGREESVHLESPFQPEVSGGVSFLFLGKHNLAFVHTVGESENAIKLDYVLPSTFQLFRSQIHTSSLMPRSF